MMGQPAQTARVIQPGQYRKERTGHNSWNRTVRMRRPEGAARKGKLSRKDRTDRQDRTLSTEMLGQDSQTRTARTGQP
jgi:hypothetical protein